LCPAALKAARTILRGVPQVKKRGLRHKSLICRTKCRIFDIRCDAFRALQKPSAPFKQCPKGAETCLGTQDGRNGDIIGLGYWKMDVRGALTFAALKFVQRDGAKTTDMNLQFQQVVEGLFMQLTNRDESRTFGYITMHENRLYIFEGTVPKGAPEPGLFQGSVGLVDAKGGSIRYTDYYSNSVHGLREQEPPQFRVDGGPPQTWPASAALTDPNHAGAMDSPAITAAAPGGGAGAGRGAGAGAGAGGQGRN